MALFGDLQREYVNNYDHGQKLVEYDDILKECIEKLEHLHKIIQEMKDDAPW